MAPLFALALWLLASRGGAGENEGTGTCESSGACSKDAPAADFFSSYGAAYVQAEMLQDDVRTTAFRDAILGNRQAFEGKVVLDVGAGTGILSFFAAQAGAARVFAVERSGTASLAKELAKANGLDGVVEVVHGLLEEVSLPVSTVDVILSEWIGTFLIHEGMLDSVLYARDRWLAPGGFMLPDRATLYLAGAEDQGVDLAAWKNFHGLDFSQLGAAWRRVGAQQCAFRNSLATKPVTLLQLDLYRATPQDTQFTRPLRLVAPGEEAKEVCALVGWFTLGFFELPRELSGLSRLNASELTTHPDEPCTHWQQTFFHLAEALPLKPSGAALTGEVTVRKPRASPRDLEVTISLEDKLNDTFFIVGADLS